MPELPDEGIIPDEQPIIKDDKQLAELIADMPEVVPDAIEASENKAKEAETVQKETVDRKGRKFDPNTHRLDKDGNPELTPTGRFKRKLNIPKQTAQQTGAGGEPSSVDPLLLSAQQYTDCFLLNAQMVIGDEAKAMPGEREAMIQAWYAFNVRYGAIAMNPIVSVLFVHAAFIASRASKPRTGGILKKLGENIKTWFSKLFVFKKKEEKK
jgi:hypothetical protein